MMEGMEGVKSGGVEDEEGGVKDRVMDVEKESSRVEVRRRVRTWRVKFLHDSAQSGPGGKGTKVSWLVQGEEGRRLSSLGDEPMTILASAVPSTM